MLTLTALGAGASGKGAGVPGLFIMLLPCMFAVGMSLLDTLDGMMMLWAYGYVLPTRVHRANRPAPTPPAPAPAPAPRVCGCERPAAPRVGRLFDHNLGATMGDAAMAVPAAVAC